MRAMSRVLIPVRIESLEEGGYLAVCEVIQGCHAEGQTISEALENLEEVARTLLEIQREDGVLRSSDLEEFKPGTIIKAELVVSVPE